MCNLSEGVWEKGMAVGVAKGVADGMAKGIAKGEFNQLMRDVGKLMSNGMKFEEIVKVLEISSGTADEIREKLNNKNDA